jgi:hypothetical protein
MDIVSIAQELNNLAISKNHDIAQLQSFRKKVLGRVAYKTIFSPKNMVNGRNYTFHSGGRKELQFNIGEDLINGIPVVRYGVAYSLERSNTEHRLLADLNPSRKRFNEYVETNPNILYNCKLWYSIGNKWGGFIKDFSIIDEVFKDNYFIFIGKYFDKRLAEITRADLHVILEEFDRLLPLYEYCLDESIKIGGENKRIMRLTWNTNNWEFPSGHPWREKNQGNRNIAYENQYGYGHEEWLFNERFRIDGFQYGYIRGVNNLSAKTELINQITLYSISNDKQRFLVGNLFNVEIIEGFEEEQQKIADLISTYKTSMVEELQGVNADFEHFKKEQLYPNVKFKWDDAAIFHQPIPVNFLDGAEFNRFQAYYLKDELIGSIQKAFEQEANFNFQSGKASNTAEYTKTYSKKDTQVKRRHSEITNDLYDHLIAIGEKEGNISVEKTRVGGAIVDVVLKKDNYFELFEIKTSNTALKNIREALGQIFEYALFDGKVKCLRLVIVGPANLKPNEREYFIRLTNLMKTKLEYWAYKPNEVLITNKFIKE